MRTIIGAIAAVFILWALFEQPRGVQSYGAAQTQEAQLASVAALDRIERLVGDLSTERVSLLGELESARAVAREQAAEAELGRKSLAAKLVHFESMQAESTASIEEVFSDRIGELESKLAALEQRLSDLEAERVETAKVAAAPVVVSSSGSTGTLASGSTGTVYRPAVAMPAASRYTPRWQNYDGKSRMQHAVEDHGIDIRGKSEAEILALMDAQHDTYGPGHPQVMRAATRTRSVTFSPATSSCPGGVCPTGPSYTASRSTNVGWYPGKLLRRR